MPGFDPDNIDDLAEAAQNGKGYFRRLDEGLDEDVLADGLSLVENFEEKVLLPLGEAQVIEQIDLRDGMISPDERRTWYWGDADDIDSDIAENPDLFNH